MVLMFVVLWFHQNGIVVDRVLVIALMLDLEDMASEL
jgi:hypothetical protein